MFDSTPAGPEPEPPPPEQRPLTADEVCRSQRANLALRVLDLEVEIILLRQENARLKARAKELETAAARTA